MLFNSYIFLFAYLPVVWAGFFVLGRRSPPVAAAWLAVASVVFYGWWNWAFVPLLLVSAAFNYGMGLVIVRSDQARRGIVLGLGVGVNLALLGYFKYAGFLVGNADALFGTTWTIPDIVLPIGISFFTFTQIAFLVDCRRGLAREVHAVHYLLFVSYFPHLIAGPVIHHADLMPQFALREIYRPQWENVARGLTLLSLGLFKKCIIADSLAGTADATFAAAAAGAPVGGLAAWGGALAYTFQIYFDFSGYSDMALGLSWMFGIRLPVNFNSPYQAVGVIDFWRRWHMTLSRFLRDYLYIPLGGNRRGSMRRHLNLLITMVLGGLWHGANWTFVAWGALHGLYLGINHFWHWLLPALGIRRSFGWPGRLCAQALTFAAVVVAWVFFRAADMDAALRVLRGMAGWNGAGVSPGTVPAAIILVAAVIAFLLPNANRIVGICGPLPRWRILVWQISPAWAAFGAGALVAALMAMQRPSAFLYFNF
ncbi:putative poly(beta-D-mannuronate) O-acetylase [Paramagnetospirillum magnetotacticum MS-1]|uniref:Probable alginate O-acetylase AlgI n=1 Tax=Paramagnetospirillum magnetotacticum MS-1 TaxID=272627 RepID=A0A0C2YRI0_PARME|nr:MBOAT family protein [Paramagnetospirillum magnetotacticum]KIL97738.1 putative poly(beta-D-mannuronate) O-acetylase [Paramagnetospirillum magnetotacticum MS-1]